MKVLIASGAFKDLYSPIEACSVIAEALRGDMEKETVSFCDGGEYTYSVLQNMGGFDEVFTDNVLNPYLKPVKGRYLVESETAHIVSSEIIRLYYDEGRYKNPLELSDYGLGQLIADAIGRGYNSINLYIGGTSTVCAGMGLIQALGATMTDGTGKEFTCPVTGKDLVSIHKITLPRHLDYSDIKMNIIADGDARSYEMSGITELKVGDEYKDRIEEVVDITDRGIRNVAVITKLSEDMPFSGAAGGLIYGLATLFEPSYQLGGDYFAKLLQLEEKIQNADVVITGEGRYDNTACGKTPVSVARFAKKHGKRLIYVCGKIKDGVSDSYLREMGIDTLLCCDEYYGDIDDLGYEERLNVYREKTPYALRELFGKIGL